MVSGQPQPTREELEQALAAARARLESLREQDSDVIGTGVIEGAVSDAPAGSPELLEEIATLERALDKRGSSDHGGSADVRH